MRKIIYYVAASVDGYISGPHEDISGFVGSGDGVERYLRDLKSFDTVIMGRKTYEFGYKFGLTPGKPAYPHMTHYIFSNTLSFKNPDETISVCRMDITLIDRLKEKAGPDIYLCGGGQFAGWLLENERIDILKVKLNPLILGNGVRLFGDSVKQHQLHLLDHTLHENGLQIITFRIKY